MQNFFNNLPSNLKYMLATSLSALAIFGVVNINPDIFSSPDTPLPEESANSTAVKFIVRGEDNQPIEGVKVLFISNGAPESRFTNTDGYVRINIPARNDIDVVLSKEEFKTIHRTINLKVDQERTRTFVLEKYSSSSNESELRAEAPLPLLRQQPESSALKEEQASLSTKDILGTEQYFDFRFELISCDKTSNQDAPLTCQLKIRNNKDDKRELYLYASKSRIIDSEGNIIAGATASLGNEVNNSTVSTKLPSNIPITGTITFKKAPKGKISLVDLNSWGTDAGYFDVTFQLK